MASSQAWDDIGLVYGDDGLKSGCVPDNTIQLAASDLGFELRVCNRASRGKPVSFLSRVYADAWTSPASIQSPLRTLLKLHTTVDTVNDPVAIGLAKTEAYLVTDSMTPIISNWCRAYQRNCMGVRRANTTDLPYWVTDIEHISHPWPQSDEPIWVDIVATDLGITPNEVVDYCHTLDGYNGDISTMPRIPTDVSLEPRITVVQDGEVLAGPTIVSKDNGATKSTGSRKRPDSHKHSPRAPRSRGPSDRDPTGDTRKGEHDRQTKSKHRSDDDSKQPSTSGAAGAERPKISRSIRPRLPQPGFCVRGTVGRKQPEGK